jgi:alpha-tubulin suppressor-like RCC1 family protein
MEQSITGRRPIRQRSRGAGKSLAAALVIAALASVNASEAMATRVVAGNYHSLWIKDDNSLWAWGDNFYGQLGDGTKVDRSAPVKVAGVGAIADVAGGGRHTIAARSDGTVLAWGYNDHGQIGDGTDKTRTLPVVLSGINGAKSVSVGLNHSMVL